MFSSKSAVLLGCDQGASSFKEMMLQDMVDLPDRLPFVKDDDSSIPISAQLFDFCDPELFQAETLTNSEAASCSNCCYEENNSSFTTSLCIPQDINYNCNNDSSGNTTTTTTTTTTITNATPITTPTTATTADNSSNLSIIFDSQDEIDNDISASINFSPSPNFSMPPYVNTQQTDQFDFSSLQPTQVAPLTDITVNVNCLSHYPPEPVVPLMGNPLPPVFEEDCLSSVPAFLRINPSSPSCSLLDLNIGSYLPGNLNNAFTADSTGVFPGAALLLGSDMQPQDLDYQGENGGIYCPDPVQRVLNSGDLQALNTESQQLVGGGGPSTPLGSEISSLEESAFKVGKLSVEQRKEKIHRYMKKRNERNFSKKIKYACRKTLADSRPRVRGRFAKNEEFGDNHRASNGIHEEDDEEDVLTVKEEDDLVDSSDIFAHISGVNSFKCNYSIQSWI